MMGRQITLKNLVKLDKTCIHNDETQFEKMCTNGTGIQNCKQNKKILTKLFIERQHNVIKPTQKGSHFKSQSTFFTGTSLRCISWFEISLPAAESAMISA
jgi:hypothetical protein